MFRNPACSTFRKTLIASVFGVVVFLIPNGVQSATSNSATLQWVANQEPDLAGYRIYHGTTSGTYGNSQNVGNSTTYQYTNLESNKTHYFSVTAYDTSGNESSPSPEVSKALTGTESLLSVSISGEGTVTSTPAGLSCSSGTCSGTFSQGSSVTLTTAPNSGSTFSGWDGACSGTSSCVLTLSSSASVSANFSTVSRSLSVSLTGDGKGSVTSSPAGLTCSEGTCDALFPEGTTVTLTPITQSGSVFQGWNGVCSGTSSCTMTLSSSQVAGATFTSEKADPLPTPISNPSRNPDSRPSPTPISNPSRNPDSRPSPTPVSYLSPDRTSNTSPKPELNSSPIPEFPFFVNFQPASSTVPPNFTKDDGDVFNSSRGYGWDALVNGKERNTNVEQTIDTFVKTPNKTPVTWNCTLPNGMYYISMVMGDPKKESGPHSLIVEGMQLATEIQANEGQYFTIVEYPVEIQDNTLSITLGGGRKGATLLNFLIINSAPNFSQTAQKLNQYLGIDLSTTIVASSGTVAKVDPKKLMKQEGDRQKVLGKIKRLLAKIEQRLANNAENPRVLANLNKKKESLLAKIQKIQEKYSIN